MSSYADDLENLNEFKSLLSQRYSYPCSSQIPSKTPLSADYRLHNGKRIESIRHKSIDVFDRNDPKESNSFYGIFNQLHVNTSSGVIRSQLLFGVGDVLDGALVAESERLLRSRAYLANAYVVVDQVCDSGVALLVVSRDVWTTEPEFSVGREGGENQHGFGLKEGNIGGSGTIFQVGYDKDATRSSIDYGFYSPHVLNTRLALAVNFTETSDGQQSHFSIERPFYSLSTPWATSLSVEDTEVVESIRLADKEINAYKHQHEDREVSYGRSLYSSEKRVNRLSFGVTYDSHTFLPTYKTSSILPRAYQYTYPWLDYHFLENTYAVYENLNLLHQTEDVSLGADVRFRIGYAGSLFDNKEDTFIYSLKYSDLLGLGSCHLISVNTTIEGRYHMSDHSLDESLMGGTIGYHYLFKDKHRWYSSLSYFQGNQLPLHKELTVGGVTGLRGYPLDYQRGSQKYVATLEKRYISNWHIFNLVRVGFVMYVDAGKAWGGHKQKSHNLVDAGFGLRLSSSKARVGSVLHIDLAVPLVDKNQVDSFQLVLKGSRGL